jgi:hypothetical protein
MRYQRIRLNARLDGPAGLQLTLFSGLPQPGASA